MGNNLETPQQEYYSFPPPWVQRPSRPPPASVRVLSGLPKVKITGDDLMEETNKHCSVCLEEQKLGCIACKLPCGHLFHEICAAEWLKTQCTCPVCRYELETDDPNYEWHRSNRMKNRKLRMKQEELESKSIGQLCKICDFYDIDVTDCDNKSQIIDRIRLSNKVIITEGLPPIEISEEAFLRKNVAELKHWLLSFGLSTEGALEKSELRNRLLESGRVAVAKETVRREEMPSTMNDFNEKSDELNSYTPDALFTTTHWGDDSDGAATSLGTNLPQSLSIEDQKTLLSSLSLSKLRTVCSDYRISTKGCIDKMDVIERIIASTSPDSILPILAKLFLRSDPSISLEEYHAAEEPSVPLLTTENINSLPDEELAFLLASNDIPVRPHYSREDLLRLLLQTCPAVSIPVSI